MRNIKGKRNSAALILALLLLFCQAIPAFAEEQSDPDMEYEMAVAETIRDYRHDPEGVVRRLAALDTELVGEPAVKEHHTAPENAARKTAPSDYTLTVYAFKRGNSDNYYLQWALDCDKRELRPGALDYVSLEWDTACADYYTSSSDGAFSSVCARSTGIVLFTLEDDALRVGDSAVGTVQVTPRVAGEMEYGSKFTHTYNQGIHTSTASYQFNTSRAGTGKTFGIGYTYTYSITTNAETAQWNLWRDNAVTMHL